MIIHPVPFSSDKKDFFGSCCSIDSWDENEKIKWELNEKQKKYKNGNDDERVLWLFLWEDYEKENIPGNEIVDGFVLFCWKSEFVMIFL